VSSLIQYNLTHLPPGRRIAARSQQLEERAGGWRAQRRVPLERRVDRRGAGEQLRVASLQGRNGRLQDVLHRGEEARPAE
jgi:hypothetical protein